MQADEPRIAIDASLVRDWVKEARSLNPGEDWGRQRHCLRYPWMAQLDLYYSTPYGRRKSICANGIDVSDSGIGLRCRQPMSLFSAVLIARTGQSIGVPGRVVSLTQTVGGYLIGVDFDLGGHAGTPSARNNR